MEMRLRPGVVVASAATAAVLTVSHGSVADAGPVPAPHAAFRQPQSLLAPQKAPDGLYLRSVETPSMKIFDSSTVYGTKREALTGRNLAAVYHPGDWYDGLPERGTSVRIPGRDRAESGRTGDMRWIAWPVEVPDSSEYAYYGVIGRGLSEQEMRTAAQELVEHGNDVRISHGGIPDGLSPLAAGSLGRGEHWNAIFPAGTILTWSDDRRGASLSLTLFRRDTATEALAGTLVAGRRQPVRGAAGMAGSPVFHEPGSRSTVMRVWPEKDAVAVVSATGVPDDEVDAFIEGLRPADRRELEGLKAETLDYPPARLLDPSLRLAASGRTDEGVWALGVRRDGEEIEYSLRTRSDETGASFAPRTKRGPLQTLYGIGSSEEYIQIGLVRRGVDRLHVRHPDGTSTPVDLGAPSIPDGARWFVVAVPTPFGTTLVAYDTDDEVIATNRMA